MKIWELEIPSAALNEVQRHYLDSLPVQRPSVRWIWEEMDRIWNQVGLGGRSALDPAKLADFYSHPVWLANGIFVETDRESTQHRQAIAAAVREAQARRVADFGGGFGSLARHISAALPLAQIDLVEPFPNSIGQSLVGANPNARFVREFDGLYDVVIAQDVLEHVDDPVELAIRLASAAKPGGLVIFANCFYPVIQCHLPQTFYLRHTFARVMSSLGLQLLETLPEAAHVQVFRRGSLLDVDACRRSAASARRYGELINKARTAASRLMSATLRA